MESNSSAFCNSKIQQIKTIFLLISTQKKLSIFRLLCERKMLQFCSVFHLFYDFVIICTIFKQQKREEKKYKFNENVMTKLFRLRKFVSVVFQYFPSLSVLKKTHSYCCNRCSNYKEFFHFYCSAGRKWRKQKANSEKQQTAHPFRLSAKLLEKLQGNTRANTTENKNGIN